MALAKIIYVGRLIYGKGVHDLIFAFDILRKNYDANLKIMGDGYYRKQLEQQASNLICFSDIIFTGTKDRKGVLDALAESDLFVNPSYSEGLPTSVMEACALGIPVIATDVGGTREVIKYGILIKPKEIGKLVQAMAFVINNKELARKQAKENQDYVLDKFSWDKITDQYDELLKQVVRIGN